MAPNRLRQLWVWLRRIRHTRGFGIQSPTDYQFVRYVISEQWPYHAYDQLNDDADHWLDRKMGRLYLRLANWRQPATIIDGVGVARYMKAGCKKARIAENYEQADLAVVPIACDYGQLFDHCTDGSVVVFKDIWKQMPLWHCIEHDERATICFDLYYCGIVVFNSRRAKQSYIVSF